MLWYKTLCICKAAEVATSSCFTLVVIDLKILTNLVACSSPSCIFHSGLLRIVECTLEVMLPLAEP